MSYKDSELIVENRLSDIDFSEELKSVLKEKQYPLVLNFDGNNVVSKVISNKVGYRNDLLFKANIEDFYFYEYFQDKQVYVSVIRKTILDDIVDDIKEQNTFVIHASLGPFVLSNLLKILKNYPSINTSNHQILQENSKPFRLC